MPPECVLLAVSMVNNSIVLLYNTSLPNVGFSTFTSDFIVFCCLPLILPLNLKWNLICDNNRCTIILSVTLCKKPNFLRTVKPIYPPMRLVPTGHFRQHQQPKTTTMYLQLLPKVAINRYSDYLRYEDSFPLPYLPP
jgi:hypothetical protein